MACGEAWTCAAAWTVIAWAHYGWAVAAWAGAAWAVASATVTVTATVWAVASVTTTVSAATRQSPIAAPLTAAVATCRQLASSIADTDALHHADTIARTYIASITGSLP